MKQKVQVTIDLELNVNTFEVLERFAENAENKTVIEMLSEKCSEYVEGVVSAAMVEVLIKKLRMPAEVADSVRKELGQILRKSKSNYQI